MIQTRDGDPADSEPAQDGWLCDELWTSDVGGRTSRPLVVWTGGGIGWVSTSKSPLTPTVIMLVPDSGSELLALSADTGQRVARIGLERGDGTLVGVPAMTPGGKVLVAHQKYDETEAALRIYELVVPGGLEEADLTGQPPHQLFRLGPGGDIEGENDIIPWVSHTPSSSPRSLRRPLHKGINRLKYLAFRC